jgi:PAS domain S-box-containing protein
MLIIRKTTNYFLRFIRTFGRHADVHALLLRMLNAQLLMASLVSLILYFIALIPAIEEHLYSVAGIYTVLFIWLLVITFFRQLPFYFRAGSWLFFLFIFGVINLILSGFNVDAGLFFIALIISTSLLMGMRMALLSLILSSLAIAIRAFYVFHQHVPLRIDLPQTDPMLWIIGGSIFFVLGLIGLISISFLMRGLIRILKNREKLTSDLTLAHEKLSVSEIRFRSLIENSSDMVFILRSDGVITYASPSVLHLWGYLPEELIGLNAIDFLHPEDVPVVVDDLIPKYPPKPTDGFIEVRIRHKDGSWRYFEYSGSAYLHTEAIEGTVVNCRDITERKNFENLLQAAKDNLEQQVIQRTAELESASARLKELVFHSPAAIYRRGLYETGERLLVTENVFDMLGYSAEQIYNEPEFWNTHIHPDDKAWVLSAKGKFIKEKRISSKYRLRHQDGRYRWIRDDMQVVLTQDGLPLELVGSWIDITSQIEAEQATRSSEQMYRKLYETMMDAFVRTDLQGRIIEFNQSYCDMLGYSPAELYRLTYHELTPEKWHPVEATIVENQILPKGFSDVYEKEYIRKDGTVFSVDLRVGLTRDAMGNPESMWAIVRDISSRKQSETLLVNARDELEKRVEERTKELFDSQERLRHLTREIITTQEEERRSVARELHDEAGQVFVTLKHSLDIALDEVPADQSDLKSRLISAQEMVDSSMELMRSLSHRLRPPAMEVGGINISLEDLCSEISEKTNLEIHYEGEDLPGLPNEIAISLYRVVQESLTNILKHAHAKKVQVKLKYSKGKIQLSVKDDGRGMLDEVHGGTGLLGLEERLHLLEGEIKVESLPGNGVHLQASIPWKVVPSTGF